MSTLSKYEDRREFYSDVESLISPGFLTHTVTIVHPQTKQQWKVTLRSLCPSDVRFLSEQATGSGEGNWKSWVVARSVCMINGHNLLLPAFADVTPYLHKVFGTLCPAYLRDTLFDAAYALYERLRQAQEDVQVYVYEDVSRLSWRHTLRGALFDERFFSFPGASTLGLNPVQRIWLSWNEFQDRREEDDKHWSLAKSNIAIHAPKAYKSLEASDKNRFNTESTHRVNALDRFYMNRLGIQYSNRYVLEDGNLRVVGASTVEELSDEFRRWVTGDLDHHDRVVEGFKNQVRENMERQEAERKARIREARRQASEEVQEYMEQSLVGYTLEDVKRMGVNVTGGAKKRVDMQDGSADRLSVYLSPYAKRENPVGKELYGAYDPVFEDEKGEEESPIGPNLMEKIAGRKVTEE